LVQGRMVQRAHPRDPAPRVGGEMSRRATRIAAPSAR
jgi:hypothetical protein